MPHDIFTQLSLVLVLGVAIASVMRFFKQPLIIGYIITGIIIGPSFLHLLNEPEAFETFSELGVALLLFITGLGLNTKIIREVGKVALIAGFTQIVLIGLLGLSMAKLLHFTTAEALIIGLALTFSSTIIVVKLINDRREQTRLYAKIAIGLLLVEDIAATVTLVILAATQTGGASLWSIVFLALKGGALGVALSLVSTKVIPKISTFLASSQEYLFLFALGWGLGIATLFQAVGFSIEVGALFAGVALASLPYSQEISSRLKPLRDFFIVVFFIALGENLEISHISSAILPALAFSALVMFAKPLIIMTTMGLLGYTKKTSFSSAVTLDQISEFSLILVVLGQKTGLVSEHAVVVITAVALITITLSTYMIMYSDKIYLLIEQRLKLFERRVIEFDQESSGSGKYDIVLFGYRKGGAELVHTFKGMKKKFVVIDYDPEVIEMLEHHRLHYLYGDMTDIELLNEINLQKTKLVVSTVTDHTTNVFLIKYVLQENPKAVIICHSDTTDEALELYDLGATYVMLPHHIGSEKISSFIRRNGLNKSEFKHHREKHRTQLEALID